MLFVIDVGNTNTVLGLYRGDELVHHWRLATLVARTGDEYGVLIRQLFAASGEDAATVEGCVISCVVPPMESALVSMIDRYFGLRPLTVGPGVKTGMPILYENPREVGADRIVNAIAAYERCKGAVIAVDFGTATTFDAISERGEYLGGAIFPGVGISSDALFRNASRLPRVDLVAPDKVIGRNTVASIQAGLVYGYVSLVDGMVERFVREYGQPMQVIATGGLSGLFAAHCTRIDAHDEFLTLEGLRLLWQRNHEGDNRASD